MSEPPEQDDPPPEVPGDEGESYDDSPTISARSPITPQPWLPAEFGDYRILERIASGGMGVVYLAEERGAIRRRVALKVIRPGLIEDETLARFEQERQALAQLNHPNIAKIFAAGTTDDDLPYFAMECVNGIPIHDYCNRNRLSTRERLEIFLEVCRALQHAHENGIVHRDIKPSNVLVTVADSRPVVKVIDFGVAKAIGTRLTNRTLHTQIGQAVGTPIYMSPEQIEPSSLGVDHRTDVYALGLLLYELLVGVHPLRDPDSEPLSEDQLLLLIRDYEPEKPSTRISGLGDSVTATAQQRQSDPSSLRRELKGDLDWITLKALAKDRTRRYQTASDLAEDVVRHFEQEPVKAGPPSLGYRLQVLGRRYRRPLIRATVAATILVGLAFTVVYVLQQRAAERYQRYVRHIRQADELRIQGALEETIRVLEECPPEHRHWEWHYLASNLDGSSSATELPDDTGQVVIDPSTREIIIVTPLVIVIHDPAGRRLRTITRDALQGFEKRYRRFTKFLAYDPSVPVNGQRGLEDEGTVIYAIKAGSEYRLLSERLGHEEAPVLLESWPVTDLNQWTGLPQCRMSSLYAAWSWKPGAHDVPRQGTLWNLGQRTSIARFPATHALALVDGVLAHGSDVAQLTPFDASGAKQTRAVEGGGSGIRDLTFSGDGRRLAIAGSLGVGVYDLDLQRSLIKRDVDDVSRVALNQDGSSLAFAVGKSVGVVSTSASAEPRYLTGSEKDVEVLVHGSEPGELVTLDGDMLRVWTRDGRNRLLPDQEIVALQVARDTNAFAVGIPADPAEKDRATRVVTIEGESRSIRGEAEVPGRATALELLDGGRRFVMGNHRGEIWRGEFGGAAPRKIASAREPGLDPPPEVRLAFRDDIDLFVSGEGFGAGEHRLQLWTGGETLLRDVRFDGFVGALTLRSDGGRFAFVDRRLGRAHEGDRTLATSVVAPSQACTALTYHPTELLLAAGMKDGEICLLDPAGEILVSDFTVRSRITCLTWTRDGARLASAHTGGIIVIRDGQTLDPLIRIRTGSRVLSFAFDPEDHSLIVRSRNPGVLIFESQLEE